MQVRGGIIAAKNASALILHNIIRNTTGYYPPGLYVGAYANGYGIVSSSSGQLNIDDNLIYNNAGHRIPFFSPSAATTGVDPGGVAKKSTCIPAA